MAALNHNLAGRSDTPQPKANHPELDRQTIGDQRSAANRFSLLRQPDLTHPAFSDFLQKAIAADHHPDVFIGVHPLGGFQVLSAGRGNIGIGVSFRG